ncbi:MAG TPA: hypothetical protein HA349_09790 [Methanotrichaceae archaeon]|nr:hypothetical protein [Methanotrichaceae archaeon]
MFVDDTSDSGGAGSWTFAVVCDTRGDNKNTTGKSGINDVIVELIAKSVADEKCDLVIFPGDMANGWSKNGSTTYAEQFENWKRAMGPVYEAGIKVYSVKGNHENGPLPSRTYPYNPIPYPALKEAYLEAFEGNLSEYGLKDSGPEGEEYLTYSFEHENALFIGLDQYVRPHRVNQAWLDEQLANNSKPYVFVFGHEPAFEVNHPDCLAVYTNDRNAFWDSISKAGCRMYFCGHDHFYNRARIQNESGAGIEIQQVLAGSCGAPFPSPSWDGSYNDSSVELEYFNDKDYGYVLVTVYEDHVDAEWRALTWTPEDEFIITTIRAPAS